MTQRTNSSSSGHEYWLHVEGDDNDIYTVQREGGSQYINLDIYTDGNDVDLIQKNDGDHYMSVILRGTEPTDISVTQNAWNNRSYSITNFCYTPGGCSISVTQQ
jgi:myo-inositol-hexaphosphate 3-phosphohydrolase